MLICVLCSLSLSGTERVEQADSVMMEEDEYFHVPLGLPSTKQRPALWE